MELYNFIIGEFFNQEKGLRVSLSKNLICIETDTWNYQETYFDQTAEFTEDDLIKLLNIVNCVTNSCDLQSVIDIKLDFLRIYYLITHEKYFLNNPSFDKHGRISSMSLREEFKTILKVPICDVIRQIAYIKTGLEWTCDKKLILTCDYDIMNIWDIYGIKDFLKLLIRCARRFALNKILYHVFSFFFSRKTSLANGYLNTKMYETKLECERIAFLIAKSDNKEIDCNANYTDKPVVDFIKSLKCNNIELGLHTNYNTMQNPNSIQEQIVAFTNKITEVAPTSNRHHYLRYHFPSYLNNFEGSTIKRDFSIYFAESLLFRCGISSPFKVWNAKKGKPFQTTLIPTTLMDGTFTDYYQFELNEAKEMAKKKLRFASDYGSTIVLLWHNSSMFKNAVGYKYHSDLFLEIINVLEQENI